MDLAEDQVGVAARALLKGRHVKLKGQSVGLIEGHGQFAVGADAEKHENAEVHQV